MAQSLSVLLVEDSEADAELVLHELGTGGHQVTCERVDTLHDLDAALARRTWDMVIADYSLPGFSAIDALGLVKERGLDVPVVVVSGTIGEQAAVAALKAGGRDCVMKDNLSRLVPVVERELAEAENRRGHRLAQEALRESEERFRRLAENAPDFIFRYRLAPTRGYEYASPAATRITGSSPEEHYADPDLHVKIVHPEDRALLEEAIGGDRGPKLVRMIRKDGEVIWTEQRIVPIHDGEGNLVAVDGFVRDLTESRRAEEALSARARQQATVVEFGQLALAGTDLPQLMDETVALVGRTLGVEFVEILELLTDGTALVLRAGVGWGEDSVGRVTVGVGSDSQAGYTLSSEEPVVVADLAAETRFTGPPLLREHGVVSGMSVVVRGSERPFGVLGAHSAERRIFGEDDLHFLQTIANVLSEAIERSRAERRLQHSFELFRETDEERRALLARLVRAQEEERRRIASDIHDDSIQVLTALTLRLDLLRRRLDDPDLLEMLREIEQAARLSMGRLRYLVFELRPPALDREGLAAALRMYLEQTRIDSGLEYSFESQLTAEPHVETRTILYRISQEAVGNVRRHARAKRIDVLLKETEEGILVRIADNGIGFLAVETDGEQPGHLGLVSMRERAEIAGGWWRLDSAPGRGTTVEFLVPDTSAPATPEEG